MSIYIYICILVGGAIRILKNMKVNGKDDIPYIVGKKHVPNHQPVKYGLICYSSYEYSLS